MVRHVSAFVLATLLVVLGGVMAPVRLPAGPGRQEGRVDNYGDPLPDGAVSRIGSIRFRHPRGLTALALSPDEKVLAVGQMDGPVVLWDLPEGTRKGKLEGTAHGPNSLAFSTDGKWVASAGRDRVIRIWDAATNRLTLEIRPGGGTLQDFNIAFSPDSKILASAGADDQIRLWDAKTGELLGQLSSDRAPVYSLAFSPDGKLLASAGGPEPQGKESAIRLWDVVGRKLIGALKGDKDTIGLLAFAADSKTLASAGQDRIIRLWDTGSGKEVGQLQGHSLQVGKMIFGAEGTRLLSVGNDGTARLWDVADRKEARRFDLAPPYQPFCCLLSGDGRRLISGTGDGAVRFWDCESGKEENPRPVACKLLALSPDSKTVTTAGASVDQWDAASGKHLRRLTPFPAAYVSGLSSDGRFAALRARNNRITLWDVVAGKELRTLERECDAGTFAFSRDGRTLAAVDTASRVRLWDVVTATDLAELPFADGFAGWQPRTVTFSPDGRCLAAAYEARDKGVGQDAVVVWEVATGKRLLTWGGADKKGGPGNVKCLIFSPDGRCLATSHSDRRIRVCEISTGKEAGQFACPTEPASALAFVGTGRYLASAGYDKTVRIWDLATGEEVRKFEGHEGAVETLLVTSDGKSVVSASLDHTLLVWDTAPLLRQDQLAPVAAKDLDELWERLGDSDPARAQKAVWALVRLPNQSVPLLQERLGKVAARVDPKRIAQLIKDLDDMDSKVRDKASAELERLGELAEPALRKALNDPPSLEVKKRVLALLDKLDRPIYSEDDLQVQRAVMVLEQVATSEALKVLRKLAEGPDGAPETREAKSALARLKTADTKP
jgi:WD40 repeat protein